MSEKKAKKLMYAIGGVSEEMLKEAEDYSENIKKMSFRRKRLKKYAKTVFAVGTAAAVIGCALLVYEKPKKSYKNELSSTGKTVEKNYDKSKTDDSMDESETFKYAIDLRSMTQGRGYFEMELEKYNEVPQQLATKIIAEANN